MKQVSIQVWPAVKQGPVEHLPVHKWLRSVRTGRPAKCPGLPGGPDSYWQEPQKSFQVSAGSALARGLEIGRAHVRTPVTNAHLVCRLLLEKKNIKYHIDIQHYY